MVVPLQGESVHNRHHDLAGHRDLTPLYSLVTWSTRAIPLNGPSHT